MKREQRTKSGKAPQTEQGTGSGKAPRTEQGTGGGKAPQTEQGTGGGKVPQREEGTRNGKVSGTWEETEKRKKRSRWLYDGIIFAGIALLGFAGFGLYGRYADRAASQQLYKVLNEQYVLPPEPVPARETGSGTGMEAGVSSPGGVSGRDFLAEEEEPEETPWNHMIRVNFKSLKERNPDVIGWIFFENENISYPILYSGDNVRYLRRTLDGKNASAGSIFLDGGNTPDFEDSRNVIYGHNMKNLSMFGKLKYYMQEKEYYEGHQYFQILSEGVVYRYRIFSYFDVEETETEMCQVDFTSEKEFSEFIGLLQSRSIRDTGIEVGQNDKVVTLLTCYTPGKRTLVNALRVDSYEIDTIKQKQEEEEQEAVQ
ncbi:MAG: class B sortase [Lachnospiraceae bacterium]|nr:class B sortase [Lachnospiraceae bacterium]